MDGNETYRPVSGLAVAALGVGCLSFLAAFGTFFWVLPLLGVCMAAAALRDLGRPESPKVGRLAALAGLALAIGFGLQGIAGTVTSRWLAARRAEQAASVFVEAVRHGRIMAARMMLADDQLYALAAGMVGGEDGTEPVDMTVVDTRFETLPAVAAVRACGPGATPRLTCRGYRAESREAKDGWLVDLALEPCATGGPCVVRLELRKELRQSAAGLVERWTVSRLQFVEPTPPPAPS